MHRRSPAVDLFTRAFQRVLDGERALKSSRRRLDQTHAVLQQARELIRRIPLHR